MVPLGTFSKHDSLVFIHLDVKHLGVQLQIYSHYLCKCFDLIALVGSGHQPGRAEMETSPLLIFLHLTQSRWDPFTLARTANRCRGMS